MTTLAMYTRAESIRIAAGTATRRRALSMAAAPSASTLDSPSHPRHTTHTSADGVRVTYHSVFGAAERREMVDEPAVREEQHVATGQQVHGRPAALVERPVELAARDERATCATWRELHVAPGARRRRCAGRARVGP